MKQLILSFTLSFLGFASLSQSIIQGKAIDIANEKPIENIMVSSNGNNLSTSTDQNGNFILNTKWLNEFGFTIINNTFTWTGNNKSKLELRLINNFGFELYNTELTEFEGSITLPYQNTGYYFLQLNSRLHTTTTRLFFNGIEFEPVFENIVDSLSVDSLYFTNDDYKGKYFSGKPPSEGKYFLQKKTYSNEVDYFIELPDKSIFQLLQSSPRKNNLSGVSTIKVVYDFIDDKIHYIQSEKYNFHYDFVSKVIGYNNSHAHFNRVQYTKDPQRRYFLCTINYYQNQDKYVIEFFGGDEISCDQIAQTYQKILSTSFLKDKLFVLNNNPSLDNCNKTTFITGNELHSGQNYQALSLEKGYGYLKKVEINQLNSTYIGRHDIVVLNGIPNDISVVSGIITTEFQTPLSHINVLSHNRKTPNMALVDAFTNDKITPLFNKLIYLEVKADTFILREANLEEASNYWSLNEPQNITKLQIDTTDKGILHFENLTRKDVNKIGGKAANFSVLEIYESIPKPEGAFAIPFVHYLRHLKRHNIDIIIDNLLNDTTFYADFNYRKTKLEIIQSLIINMPIDTILLNLVKTEIKNFSDYNRYKFRSSTNAEDLDFFSGAGLYSSYAAEKDNPKKSIEEAIKKVWASAWNLRAFEEREYYKIDQRSIAMGILVHRSFENEVANGVIITRNLYNTNDGIIVNAQYGNESIVYPKKGVIADEILVYNYKINPTSNYTTEYFSRSNILPEGVSTVLSPQEIDELAVQCRNLKAHYYYVEEQNCNCTFRDFALDIEFKIDIVDGNRKVYIKQVRPYQ